MNISIFTDELYVDVDKALPVIKGWGVTHVDFRGMINGMVSKSVHYRPLWQKSICQIKKDKRKKGRNWKVLSVHRKYWVQSWLDVFVIGSKNRKTNILELWL